MKRRLLVTCLFSLCATFAWADLKSGLHALELSDYATALQELTPSAEAGDATAQFNLGKMYLYGWGMKRNGAEAIKWFTQAAEQGHGKARDMLVYMYERGESVAVDQAIADNWRRKDLSQQKTTRPAPASPPDGKISLPNLAREGRGLSREQAAAQEKQLKTNPEDQAARARLLGYYYHRAQQDLGKPATIQARRRHILWTIQHQPNSTLASLGEALLAPSAHALADRTGYEQAKALWLKQADAMPDKPLVLLHAANFLQLHDKPLTETLLKKGANLYPQQLDWSTRLGYLYTLGILGIDGLNTNGIPISASQTEQNGAFAQHALKQVDESSNPLLIGTTGAVLGQYGLMLRAMRLSQQDYSEVAERFLLKAQSLEPTNANWAAILGELYRLKSTASATREEKLLWSRKSLVQLEKSVSKATDEEHRAHQLAELSKTALAAEANDKASQYAQELLAITAKHTQDPKYDNAVHTGNTVLGRLSLQQDNRVQAKAYLLKSAQVSGGGTLSSFGPNMSLAKELLEHGEKEAVIQYLKLCKKFWSYPRNPLDQWIQDIQQGRQPNFAQNLNY